jgi:hypothetical protein
MESKIVKCSFGNVTVLGNIISVVINEGTVFQAKDLNELYNIYDTYFPNTNFGYISNRINDYSIALNSELYRSIYHQLTATAIVCYSESSFKNANFEKNFYKSKPCEVFKDYDSAVKWLNTYL